MANVTATWSPSSLQLRWAMNSGNCSKPSPILVRMRRARVVCASQDRGRSPGSTNGVQRRRNGSSWVESKSTTADGFSGWSGSEGEDDSQKKKWSGGLVAAGVAGVILVAGVTVAALSSGNKANTRPKPQMEPLTTEQEEVLLVNDDRNADDVDEQRDAEKDGGSPEEKAGTNKDCSSSSREIDESPSLYRVGNDCDIGEVSVQEFEYASSGGGSEAINSTFIQEDMQHESISDDKLVEPETLTRQVDLPESDHGNDSFVSSGLEDSDSSLAVGTGDLTSELKENPVSEPVKLPVSDAINSDLSIEPQDELPGTSENQTSTSESSTVIAHEHHEPIAVDVSVSSESNISLEPLVLSKDNVGVVSPPSTNPSETVQVLAEGNSSSLEVHTIVESGSSATSVSEQAYPIANEQYTNYSSDMNTSKSQLPTPRNSFSSAGIPAPTLVSAAVQVLPGKVLVPAVVDQVQGQALAALQVLKVIEPDVQPGDLCTRREYARWLVSASSALSRNSLSKVYPAMYIENITELAFDDITPEDPDFPSIQGLAESGLISSKLSRHDMDSSLDEDEGPYYFSPASPLSRQDLVSWKMALEKRHLPEADRKVLHQISGFIDTDKIHPDACPALVADLSGEQGIIALAFGYTRLFQPNKPVTKAQAAIALATGEYAEVVSEELARIEAETMAEKAVDAHNALVAQVEKDVNATFEKDLSLEREKIDAVQRMAEAAKQELERLRSEREQDNIALMKERAAVESEMEVLARLRHEVEEQLENLMSNKVEISFEKERVSKLRKDAENESQEIARLQYDLEVERKALSMARAWAEDEAKRAREQAKSLEEARDRWERHGIKVVVDNDLREEALGEATWVDAGKQFSVEGTVSRAKNLMDKLKAMAVDIKGRSKDVIFKIIQKIALLISTLREWVSKAGERAGELKDTAISKANRSAQELQRNTLEYSLVVKEGAKRVADDCREGVEKLTQRFKT
ncbi:PREDICTED: uncharacterized protein LOC101314705 isoform X1 [Fragaria vesca subsp. vesca]|uniref:uncharacterized protein LOC101314705 isoform X1 n=1 Tax=Fragaria vesca subsp. vesca TaxID=101020 RepID=UPI0002C349FA|nr:PREDICTED: uncharacterized protein LOC101314705 isoform X1 [Fragaria vesca subsp. vesca]